MIYYVEDDPNIRDLVIYTLRQTGLEARGFPAAGAFLSALQEAMPDLILLDIMLPGEDGFQILKRLRASAQTAAIPVIMITARDTEYDTVVGLDAGADDYIAKPFGMMELVARVKAMLRRTAAKMDAESITVNDLTVDARRHVVTVAGEPRPPLPADRKPRESGRQSAGHSDPGARHHRPRKRRAQPQGIHRQRLP